MNKNKVYALMDYETTGLDYFKDFPIEIAIFFLNHEFSILDVYHRYIKWNQIVHCEVDWKEEFLPAYGVHKIEFDFYKENSIDRDRVCIELTDICKKYSTDRKPIIMSDAPDFEMSFTRRLFNFDMGNESVLEKEKNFPFHHNAQCINLMCEVFGQTHCARPNHSAIQDVGLMYQKLIRALSSAAFFNRFKQNVGD